MTFFDAFVLGIIEGLTEFLPISSTAHLVIGSKLLQVPESAFLSSFIIAIQLGAIASVVLLYWRTIVLDIETMKRVVAAFIPTAIIGFALYQLVKDVLIESLPIIAIALIVGGIVLIVFEYLRRDTDPSEGGKPIGYREAVIIGLAQALAIVPGVSRAGATIVGGMLLGVGRKTIVEFSFLLAVPTMLMATAYDLYKSGGAFAESEWSLLAAGFVTSFIAALLCITWLVRYIQSHSFTVFGIYRIVIGVIILVFTL